MPCYDAQNNADRADRNTMARFCCETLTQMEKDGKPIPDYIKRWWKEHKEWDAYRGRHRDEGN